MTRSPQAILQDVGATFGPVAFSSLCATRDWLATEMAQAFMRAYARSRTWVAG